MAAGTRRGSGAQIDADRLQRIHGHVTHRIKLGRRIHELLGELSAALSLYQHHVLPECEDDMARFRDELRRVRGGTSTGCPILLELAHPDHVERVAFTEIANNTGLSGNALEQGLGRSRGYASKAKEIELDFPANTKRCECCGDRDALATAAVFVVDEKTSRRVLEKQALCIDCYDAAIADE